MSLMGLLGFEAFAESSAVHPVTMKSLSYEPKQLTIKAGDSIEWTNKSYTDHSATADDGSAFDTGMVHPGQKSKKIVFKQAGTFEYHCSMHGKTMHGEVTVQP